MMAEVDDELEVVVERCAGLDVHKHKVASTLGHSRAVKVGRLGIRGQRDSNPFDEHTHMSS